MCGVAGWLSFTADLHPDGLVLEAMTATMECRGPDEDGVWLSECAGLGSRRLAVIDRAGGGQPMRVETAAGPVALVYSGEVYNFRHLRHELARLGHRFESVSDTEVVLRGYLQWGIDVVDRLRGMYGFAVWDGRVDQLVLVRDRLGIKPLFYFPTDDGVVFGSELKALFAHPHVRPVMGVGGFRELFGYTRTPGHGVWEGVAEVEPGAVVTVDRRGIAVRRYWRLEPDRSEASNHLRGRGNGPSRRVGELVAQAVGEQTIADVPVGALLSGGLDSSVVTSLAAPVLAGRGEQLRTFTLALSGSNSRGGVGGAGGTEDFRFARLVAEQMGTAHGEVDVGVSELTNPRVRAAVVRAHDLPLGMGDLDASLFLLFESLGRQVSVVLTGEGADEAFAGYSMFSDPAVLDAETFPWLVHLDRISAERQALRPDVAATLALESYVPDCYRSAMANIVRVEGERDGEFRMRQVQHLCLTRFLRQLLDRKDRVSMAVSVEARVPFCDHRLIQMLYDLPWSLKAGGAAGQGVVKSLLRSAVVDVVPRPVLERAKQPYPSVSATDYTAELQRQSRELLSRRGHPVFDLLQHPWLASVVDLPAEHVPYAKRRVLERALDLEVWFDLYGPEVRLA